VEIVFQRESISGSTLPATSKEAIKRKPGTRKHIYKMFFIVPCEKLEQAQGEFLK
jgi:hypothetical protein